MRKLRENEEVTAALVAHHVAPAAASVALAVGVDEEGVAAGTGDEDDAAVRGAGAHAAEGVWAHGVVVRCSGMEPVQRLCQHSVALLLLAAAQVQALKWGMGWLNVALS